jgi:small-conductance mechanosensitive channel
VDGMVEHLGWRAVQVRSRDDEIHFVPNSLVFQHVVSNRSLSGGYTRIDIPFEISSTVELSRVLDAVTAAVADVLSKDEHVDASKPIRVICTEIDSDKAQAIAQVSYSADRSVEGLSTKVLQTVSAVLLKLDAMPVRQVALNRPKRI